MILAMKKNIILIGFMGSGKSVLGKLLARELNYSFIDCDSEIEAQERLSISDIFAKYGEEHFRRLETQMLKQLCGLDGAVISTGGGAVTIDNNIPILKEGGIVVFLNASADEIASRLVDDTTRPLLQCEDKLQRINNILDKRIPLYRQTAHIIINVDGKAAEDNLKELLLRLSLLL